MAAHGESTRVEFVPFGVDEHGVRAVVDARRPSTSSSVGADPHRDVELFLARRARDAEPVVPARHDGRSRARARVALPANLEVETDIPFDAMQRRLEEARVVALPVLENSYSGATTVLLQAMALGKPVVVTRTKAIASGYGLVDGDNCRLVEPGDAEGSSARSPAVLRDEWHAPLARRARPAHGRGRVSRWDRYVDRIERVLRDACEAPQGGRSGRG